MRKALLLLFVAGFFITCKKDKSPSVAKETVLSKVFFNNTLVYEFIYSPQKQMTRYNEYDEKTGKFEYASGLEYDAGGRMVKENQYNSTNKLTGQVVYTWLPGGGLSHHQYKSLSGADSGQFTNRVNYSYDGAGRVSQRAWVDLVSSVVYTSADYSYYNSNNLRSSAVYYYYGAPELQWKTDYTDGNPIPSSLLKYKSWPINFYLFDLVTGERHFTSYNNGTLNGESKEIFSDRKYDNAGFLISQTITRKNILPLSPNVVIQAKYEYIQL
jgi:hypothetical protein